jgi:hypothetical protein
LFVDTSSIEKQKNLRQVSGLIHDSILQAIRGLLPVRTILREYLHEDDDEEGGEAPVAAVAPAAVVPAAVAPAPLVAEEEDDNKPEPEPLALKEPEPVVPELVVPEPVGESLLQEALPKVAEQVLATPTAAEAEAVPTQQMIYIDTKPSVSFAQEHVMFDSNTLEANEIHDLPFAEAETRVEEPDDDDEEEDLDKIKITDEVLAMDADEILS